MSYGFLESGVLGQSFERFKLLATNSQLPQELQELTLACTIQLRTSQTEYDSDTNLKIDQFLAIEGFMFCVG